MKKILKSFVFVLVFLFSVSLFAGDGMWLPLFLKTLNEKEMQDMGMKMTAEDIYSVNKGSLKDAIVRFGGGCTAEIISPEGLLLTNHHCGFGSIQRHTTLENNYLEDGFWAKTRAEELPNPGLEVTFIVRIEEVTNTVLKGVTDKMGEADRQSLIDKNITVLKKTFVKKEYEDLIIKPFFKGNQYFLFVTMTYNDVRLVGAPPSAIGKFGADTDNWVWPRHSADFSMFRIYAGKDNLPAPYSPDNVPYSPKHYLPVSLDGVEEGDFTLVFGFPGRTNEYLPSPAVAQTVDLLNPAKIKVRETALKIMDGYMKSDKQIKIQYASKYAGISNYWKKWIGESLGLKRTHTVAKKQAFEKEFMRRVMKKRKFRKKYKNLLPQFEKLYKEIAPYAVTEDIYYETFYRNTDLTRVAGYLDRLVTLQDEKNPAAYDAYLGRIKGFLGGFYKNYSPEIDRDVFAALMEQFTKNVKNEFVSSYLKKLAKDNKGDFEKIAETIFNGSFIVDKDKMMATLEKPAVDFVQALKKDPAYQFAKAQKTVIDDIVSKRYNEINDQINNLQRTYMKALMEVFPKKRFYPDANSTMRVTYGKVNGYEPRDAVYYQPKSYLKGVMEKYVPGDYEFDVPEKLRQLYVTKDYGQYQENGKMPVCFIGTNHTTGGNSGSPAIDAYGNLVGLNFDRVWEGTMSDINYDASLCRNIMVDIRYILFIIDKYAGAKHLIDEMTLVHPKKH